MNGNGTPPLTASRPTLVYGYVKSRGVFLCPAGSPSEAIDASFITNTGNGSNNAVKQVHSLSYALNVIPNQSSGWTTAKFRTAGTPKWGYVGTGTTVGLNEAQIDDSTGTIRIVDSMTKRASTTTDPWA